ncbi:hypothetical protein BH11MYX2_BH11MYX2_01540 [soil metagenome]
MLRCSSICLLLFVAACGDDGGANHPPDAPIGIDAPAPDAPPATGSVNILATSRSDSGVAPGTPVQDVLVVALKKDGSLASTAMTAADGTATLTGLSDGASVTAVYPITDNDHNLVTYVDVKIGDHLTFGDKYYAPYVVDGAEGTLAVTWQPVTDALYYRVFWQCNPSYGLYVSSGTNANLSLDSYCQTATTPLVVKAFGMNDTLLASIHLTATASTPGTTLDLTADQWVTPTPDNLPVSLAGLSAPTNDAYVGISTDFRGLSYTTSRYLIVTSGAAMTTYTVAALDAATAFAELSRDGNYGAQYSYKRGTGALVLPAPTLPWLGGLIVNATQAVWLQSSGSAYDAGVLQLNWNRQLGGGGGGGVPGANATEYFHWSVILPPNLSSFSFPTPPAALAAFLPDDSTNVSANLELIDLSSAGDYDAARALPEYRLTDLEAAVRSGDEPSGTSSTSDGGEGFGFDRIAGRLKQQLTHAAALPHVAKPRARH